MSWPDVPIKDVCLLAVDCVNKTAPVVDYETPYRMLRTTNVRGGFVDAENTRFVTEETFVKWTRRGAPQKGDVILTREAPLGDVGRLTSENTVFLGQRLFMYRADPEKLNSQYLAYVLQSPLVQGRIKSKGFGATVEHARVGDCENLLIPVPDITTQDRVGTILSAYDDLIENNKRRIELLEESARQLYKEWFVRFRFPGHEHVKIIDGVPEGWTKTTYGEAAETVGGGTPSTKVPEYWEDGDVTWFVPKDLTNNNSLVLLDSEKKITKLGLQKSSAKMLPPNTIMMSSRASIGYFGLYDGDASTNQGFISVIPKQENTHMYLLHNLMSRKDEIIGLAGGTTYKEINKTTFRSIELLIPPDSLVDEFQDFASDLISQVRLLMKQIKHLTSARDILLPKLMNGEIVV